MRISVCVATRNRTDMLHQLLWSLIRQEYPEWDLIVVDDSDVPVQWSSLGVYPRLFNEIARGGHGIRIIPGPRASRIAAAYQAGFRVAREQNPLFFRVDDDSWLEPDYFSQLVQLMHDESLGACAGLFLHPGQEIETYESDDERYRHARIEFLSDYANVQWAKHVSRDLIPVEHLTANILFSKKWLQRIGGFETHLYRLHRDETQVTWRLAVEGAKLFVNPAAVAWHLKGQTGGARGHAPEIFLEDHRTFMAQRKSMRSGIHLSLGHGIGDGLMATPMIHMMREANGDRNIAVFAPWAGAVLAGNPDVDVVADHPLDEQRTVRLEQSVYAWASAHGWKGHLTEAYCKMFDLPIPEDITPRLHFTEEKEALRLPDAIRYRPFMLISPWSTAQTFDLYQPSGNKNWPMDRWLPVVAWAHEKGLSVVQMRGSDEEPLIAGVDLDFCGQPLRAAFFLVKEAEVVVSVDTMTHHVAAALNVPAVVLWGRSTASHFGYEKKDIINIQGECPGIQLRPHSNEEAQGEASPQSVVQERPCVHGDQWAMDREVCPIAGHPCMSSITWEMVRAALERLILSRNKPCSGGLNAA